MKASELRIGNLLRDKVSKTELEVVELTENNITTKVINRSKFPLKDEWRLEYIPLTEEWLIKFGFKKRDMLSSVLFDMKNPRFSIYLNPPIDKSNKWNILGIEKNVNIQYVHQLQNLFFCLCGKELTLKP